VVQLDVGDGWGDEKQELSDACHVPGIVSGIETDRCLHPLTVRCHPGSKSGCRYLSTQGLDDAPGRNVPRAPKYDVECFTMLVVARLRVRVDIHGVQLPLGILELHLLIFLLLRVHFLLALSLAGRCTFLVRLLLLFVELFHELVDLSTLTRVVARGVVHWASGTTVIVVRRLMGALVASWATATTRRRSCSSGSTIQRLVVAIDLLLVLVLVAAALGSGPRIRLAFLPCL
jgi:hypothetical protein